MFVVVKPMNVPSSALLLFLENLLKSATRGIHDTGIAITRSSAEKNDKPSPGDEIRAAMSAEFIRLKIIIADVPYAIHTANLPIHCLATLSGPVIPSSATSTPNIAAQK